MGTERYNDKVNNVIEDVVWEVVSCYCPQSGRSVNEEEFYKLMDMVGASEVLVGSDMVSSSPPLEMGSIWGTVIKVTTKEGGIIQVKTIIILKHFF